MSLIRGRGGNDNFVKSGIADYNDTETAVNPINLIACLLYTSPSPRDRQKSRMPSSA